MPTNRSPHQSSLVLKRNQIELTKKKLKQNKKQNHEQEFVLFGSEKYSKFYFKTLKKGAKFQIIFDNKLMEAAELMPAS